MSKLTRGWDAFTSRLQQTVETRTRRPRFSHHTRDVRVVSPGENIADYWEMVESTSIIRTSLLNFAFDVAGPGIRLDGDDTAVEYLREAWLPQAAIINGERHNPFDPILPQTVMQRWGRGGMMLEHVRADPSDPESPITGVNPVRPETGVFQTIENRDILVEPSDHDNGLVTNPVMTDRGEAAAFIQWHPDAIHPRDDRNNVPLSTNDFTRTVFGGDVQDLWGTPVTETVNEDVTGFKNILRDKEKAIKTKAYGLWMIGFGRESLEYQDEDGKQVTEIIEWSEDDQDDWIDDHLGDMSPGDIVTHDGAINPKRLEGEVPDVIDDLEFYVSNITAAMPTPKYVVGFEENINQFVTEGQDDRYQLLINRERKALASFLTQLFEAVIQQNLVENTATADGKTYSVDGDFEITARIEPPEETSPILSLTAEEIEKIGEWMAALNDGAGAMDPAMLVDEEILRELILQLPEDSQPDLEDTDVDEDSGEVQEQLDRLEEIVDNGGSVEGQAEAE